MYFQTDVTIDNENYIFMSQPIRIGPHLTHSLKQIKETLR